MSFSHCGISVAKRDAIKGLVEIMLEKAEALPKSF
jgi:hypothetical protein